jgi:hypothetical protein
VLANVPNLVRRPFFWVSIIYLLLGFGRVLTNNPWCDEGFFFDPVYNWITKGHTGTSVLEATGFPWEGIERHQYWQPPMHLLIHGLWLKIFPLTLFAFRSCSLFAGLICLFLWRRLFRYLGLPKQVEILSLLLISVDYSFLYAASDGRTDMLAATLGLGAVVAYLHFRESDFGKAVLFSQFLAVCGGLTHPMGGLIYLAVIGLLFLLRGDWRRVRWFHPLLAAIPYVLGALGWGAYIMQEPETFKRIFFGSSVAGRMNGIFHPLISLQREIVLRYLVPNGWGSSSAVMKIKTLIPFAYFATLAIALAVPAIRRMKHMPLLLALCGITELVLFVFDGQRNGTYLNHIFPYFAAIFVTVVCYLWNSAQRPLRIVGGIALAGELLLQIGGSGYIVYTNPYRNDYLATVRFVQDHTKPNSYVMATIEFGFGFGFDNMRDDVTLGYYSHREPDAIVVDERYRYWFEAAKKDAPARSEFTEKLLRERFHPAFHNRKYDVYLKNAESAAFVPVLKSAPLDLDQ